MLAIVFHFLTAVVAKHLKLFFNLKKKLELFNEKKINIKSTKKPQVGHGKST